MIGYNIVQCLPVIWNEERESRLEIHICNHGDFPWNDSSISRGCFLQSGCEADTLGQVFFLPWF